MSNSLISTSLIIRPTLKRTQSVNLSRVSKTLPRVTSKPLINETIPGQLYPNSTWFSVIDMPNKKQFLKESKPTRQPSDMDWTFNV